MEGSFIYRRIADSIRQDILEGRLQPGDRLPSIRAMTQQWNCTTGTVQRAYNELVQQGLVISQAGKGTHVSGVLEPTRLQVQVPLRRANMVNRAEAFLLESITAGYSLKEVLQSIQLATDRWLSIRQEEPQETAGPASIRFAGSHDLALVWIANPVQKIGPAAALHLQFSGSLGGLITLAEGKCDLAGSHLYDTASGQYNVPFIQKLFPGKRMRLVHLASRRIGLILAPGNPKKLHGLTDLTQAGVRFANRQSGSGTRVWLDETLRSAGIQPRQIDGYSKEMLTHTEVARAIAGGQADTGIGLENAAAAYGLDFIHLTEEDYDLVALDEAAGQPPLKNLLDWLGSSAAREVIGRLPGYNTARTGESRVLDL